MTDGVQRVDQLTTVGSGTESPLPLVDISRLTVLHATDKRAQGRMLLLEGEQLAFGREADACVRLGLHDNRMSRSHAHLACREGVWSVRDLGSTHGTFIDGSGVECAPLRHGAVLRVGSTLLLYEHLRFPLSTSLLPETPPLLGPSVGLQRVRGEIAQIGPANLPVLVLGETGVGKELVARTIHATSKRSGPFVAINCAALPSELAERELFGNERGAFTGADQARKGLFEEAHQGTLLLDEVGELAAPLQAKLLRAIAEGEIRRVGATAPRKVDVRIVAATHRELSEPGFRDDLRARLSGWVLHVPPLRERRADIVPFAERFAGGPVTTAAAEALLLHSWPLNVRELRQAMESARVRSGEEIPIGLEHLPPYLARSSTSGAAAAQTPLALRVRARGTPTSSELAEAMEYFEGNVSNVAAFFGKERRQVYRWLDNYGLR